MSKLKHIISPLTLVSALVAPAIGFAHPDLEVFHPNTFAEQPVTVDCTLENGTAAVCYEIVVNYRPAGVNIGPFCPTTVANKGGIWDWTGENAKLYRVDETFPQMLDDFGYRFFNDDGAVHTVSIATERPTADHACINVSPDDTVKMTMRLPVTPVVAETPDTCRRWTPVAGILTQDSSALFGYAFDGFPVFGSREMGGAIRLADDTGSEQRRPDNGQPRGIPRGFDEAAATLGVTTEKLMRALETPQGGRPDLAKAAKTLGVPESRLRETLPPPPGQ
ncbi:hypothetical protein [Pseudosulfitobacter sp. SM2401]|uniref:hypothetical protein n=1 Tax=Pseudosulfitobacter sp. SM2401 TaxID=3350098 RepID=UPI0036F2F05D